MKWLKELYVGANVADRKALIELIEHPVWKTKYAFSCVISPAPQSGENLEVLPLIMLNEKHFNREDRVILGIASGRTEADGLMLRMTQDCLDAGGGVDVKGYFLSLPDDAYTESGGLL